MTDRTVGAHGPTIALLGRDTPGTDVALLGRDTPGTDVALLLAAFAGAVAVRVAIAGPARAASVGAGLAFAVVLAFAALLAALALSVRPTPRFGSRALLAGLAGSAVLVLPVLLMHHAGEVRPAGSFAGWAAATAVVATAEEAFLRGVLFTVLERWRGADVAVAGAAVAFALLHVPLYGWHVLPLDLAVGLLLGALRLATGGWAAPAVAHVGADLAGWWLV